MDTTPAALVEALESGETERVNEAIDAVDDLEPVERAAIYDECLDRCEALFEEGDGYQRQSVVRFLREAYPRVELASMDGDLSAFEGVSNAQIEAQRDRVVELLLAALADDDGRVRKAAVKTIKLVGTAMKVREYDAELDAVEELLAELESSVSEDKQKHVEQARYNVERKRGVGLFLSSTS